MSEDNKTYWTLIEIKGSAFLAGKSVFDILLFLLEVVSFKFVVLDGIEGCGKDWLISSLQEEEDTIMNIKDFLKVLNDVKSFEWGDFFLFKEYPSQWNNPKGELYPYVIAQTDTTVRAFDGTHIFIYTPYQEVVKVIKEHYLVKSIKTTTLDNLDYPE
jgi:hypothetical protein